VVFEDFAWLWGSSDRQGALSAVLPSSSSPGQMWSSGPVRRLPVRNQQRQPDSERSGSGGAPLTRSKVEDEGLLKDFVVIFVFLGGALYCSLFLLMPESYSPKNIDFSQVFSLSHYKLGLK
jgi:hypothetical protein